jgi:NADH-quinone oxidoreductase subunit C
MAEITNQFVSEELYKQFGDVILSTDEPYGMLTVVVEVSAITSVVEWLKNHSVINAHFLTDICGSHFPQVPGKELCAIYHMQSMPNNFRIRLKCFVPISKPEVPSLTGLFPSANWMERETYDYYGIQFTGHPNLQRILNVDEMDYFPLRKEFPLEDGTRTDKDDQYFGR